MSGSYCELHAHSCYSLLDGVPSPRQLVEWAAAYGMPALALTDHDALYGVVEFVAAAREFGIKPLIGAELTLEDQSHLTLLAETQAGYRNLCQLITAAQLNAPKGRALLPWGTLFQHTDGLLCLTGCRRGLLAHDLLNWNIPGAAQTLETLIGYFGPESVYVELQRNLRRDDMRLSKRLAALAREFNVPVVATGNVHYLRPADAPLQDMLVAIREHTPLPQAVKGKRPSPLRSNSEYCLRHPNEMAALFPDLPEAIANTAVIAERCTVTLPGGLQVLPTISIPRPMSADAYLRQWCFRELPRHYVKNLHKATQWLEKELAIIARLGLANYFLLVADIVQFCARSGILCHGRGSAANSLVTQLLGISALDPIALELVPERFISVEHGGTPDIDLDIDAAKRETVIQYVYEKWGRAHSAMACTFITYCGASAIRDAGQALGFKPEVVDEIADALEQQRRVQQTDPDGRIEEPELALTDAQLQSQLPAHKLTSAEWSRLITFAEKLRGRPRHIGQHNGGMVLSRDPIATLFPVEPARMENRTVIQLDKDALEMQGLVKVDLLGLRMLSVIADTLDFVKRLRRKIIYLHRLDFRDPRVYDLINTVETIGIFQVESGAQASLIPELQPRSFHDLIVQVSLIRPGPLQAQMVRPYLRRRQGKEPVTYAHASLEAVLKETYGVLVFQEDVLKVAMAFAGFSPGRAELLRRTLGSKHAGEKLDDFKAEFILGALEKNAGRQMALTVWAMLRDFAGYSFSRAHAAAYAVIVYWSAWLRLHYPVEYFCSILRHCPLGSYSAETYENEARRIGIRILPLDINRSQAKPTVEGDAIRHGFDDVKGLGDADAEAIVDARGHNPFRSLVDFIARTAVDREQLKTLILAGAFDIFGDRRKLIWKMNKDWDQARSSQTALPLPDTPDERVSLPKMTSVERLGHTFAATGLTGGIRLVDVKKDKLAQAGCLSYAQLKRVKDGQHVRVGGWAVDGLRSPRSAHGVGFVMLDLGAGRVDVVVPREQVAACRALLRRSRYLIFNGVLQHHGPKVMVVAQHATGVD